MSLTTLVSADRRSVLDAANALFDSLGQALVCVDDNLRIAYAPADLRDLVGIPVATALGSEVDTLLRQGRRADTRAVLRTSRATRGVAVTMAPYIAPGGIESELKYVLVLRFVEHSDDDRARLVAALEANRWRRDAAARSLGMSRATLWRKMRAYGLL